MRDASPGRRENAGVKRERETREARVGEARRVCLLALQAHLLEHSEGLSELIVLDVLVDDGGVGWHEPVVEALRHTRQIVHAPVDPWRIGLGECCLLHNIDVVVGVALFNRWRAHDLIVRHANLRKFIRGVRRIVAVGMHRQCELIICRLDLLWCSIAGKAKNGVRIAYGLRGEPSHERR